jgi:hypothetical protein
VLEFLKFTKWMSAMMFPIIPALVIAYGGGGAISAFPIAFGSGSSSLSPSSSANARVWDDVLPDEDSRNACLSECATALGSGHRCFVRPLSEDRRGRCNAIERTLDAILTEIEDGLGSDDDDISSSSGDGNNGRMVVEYWTRQEWRHIEAHADVDENLSKLNDQRCNAANIKDDDCLEEEMRSKYPRTFLPSYGHRYPLYGHVLYLQVGTNVSGPTCIFPGRTTGGELTRAMANPTISVSADDNIIDNEDDVRLTIVPAVPGRLLRFDGRDMHAVPRPSDIWMLPFVRGSPEYEPRELWGRSVVLFNVWPHDEEPPLDVPLDAVEDDPRRRGGTTDGAPCNPFDEWNEVSATTPKEFPPSDPQSNRSVKVWLLGNERRRDHPLRTVSLLAPEDGGRDAVREALVEKNRVTELRLRRI